MICANKIISPLNKSLLPKTDMGLGLRATEKLDCKQSNNNHSDMNSTRSSINTAVNRSKVKLLDDTQSGIDKI